MNRLLTLLTVLFLTSLACASPVVVLTPTPTSLPTRTPNALVTAKVTALEALHVRREPLGIVIGYLYSGNSVTLTGICQTGWAQIAWEGGTAFVNARYLSDNLCKE